MVTVTEPYDRPISIRKANAAQFIVVPGLTVTFLDLRIGKIYSANDYYFYR